jgi:hypothetical protein
VDAEPDPRDIPAGLRPPWRGFTRAVDQLEAFRRRAVAASARSVQFNWFLRMDPQLQQVYGSASWALDAHRELIDRLRSAGDQFGLHVHAYRWDAKGRRWIIDYADAAWIDECLSVGFGAFEAALGERCRIFRFGDHWMNQRAFERITALGVEIDLTLEPGHDDRPFYPASEPFIGRLPDYRTVPVAPYRPSTVNYQAADVEATRGIWELPVTTSKAQPRLLHRLYRRWISRRRSTSASTALVSVHPPLFRRIVDDALGRPVPHLVLTLRTEAANNSRLASTINANLSGLLARREASRFWWTTPASAIQLLDTAAKPRLANQK